MQGRIIQNYIISLDTNGVDDETEVKNHNNHIYFYSVVNNKSAQQLNIKLKEIEEELLNKYKQYEHHKEYIYLHINSYGDCYDKNNVFNEGDHICVSENFDKVIYNNSGTGTESGLCKKKTWANKCKVTWDGITNNSQLCI